MLTFAPAVFLWATLSLVNFRWGAVSCNQHFLQYRRGHLQRIILFVHRAVCPRRPGFIEKLVSIPQHAGFA